MGNAIYKVFCRNFSQRLHPLRAIRQKLHPLWALSQRLHLLRELSQRLHLLRALSQRLYLRRTMSQLPTPGRALQVVTQTAPLHQASHRASDRCLSKHGGNIEDRHSEARPKIHEAYKAFGRSHEGSLTSVVAVCDALTTSLACHSHGYFT